MWQPLGSGSVAFWPVSSPAVVITQQSKSGFVLGMASGEIAYYDLNTQQEQVISLTQSSVLGLVIHPHERLVLASYALSAPETWLLQPLD